ncbi:hypothetical protein [Pseudoalteromonas sp. SR45-4]|uniref:hypothetical protein n=1 Tax=Pseudoalteromonas sp. SR45-4 TaxID=2760929 RepID=UPI0015F94591|nr:hypothetical protein [Pseudoalteromonas sp. SR45-4]MBB1370123.1 hypothetical protein [Pseudoalteromonas sp. SR45-4]
MQYLVISDIYGKTPCLQQLAKHFNAENQIVDPYNGVHQALENEEEYYKLFIKHCGHDEYAAKLEEYFNKLSKPTICIAFSAGASAAWRAQASTTTTHLKKVIAFYPTQIRNYLNIDAIHPCEFIFPGFEPHFNVDELITNLSAKNNVRCLKTLYLHGFMNQQSQNFSEYGYQYFL